MKIGTAKQQLTLLIRCRRHDVFPPHIENMRFYVSFRSNTVNRKFSLLKKRNQRSFLNLEIKDTINNLNFLYRKVTVIEDSLLDALPKSLVTDFFKFNYNKILKHECNMRSKAINKFDSIKQKQFLNPLLNIDHSKWIVNISNKNIPNRISKFLSLGDKFGLPINPVNKRDRTCSVLETIKNFESNCYKIPEKLTSTIRNSVANSLHTFLCHNSHASYIDRYILKEFKNCNNFLRENPDVFVTKADKGQVTVIMDKNDYVSRMTELLCDSSTYQKLKKDPIKQVSNKLNNLIKAWHENNIIDDFTYKKLNCTNGNLPRCYGLPKVHKIGHPLRIIVSAIGSPLYNVASFLHDILHRSIKKPDSFIKDSWSLVKSIKKENISDDESLVSLDVTALFTNIPKELVLKGIKKRWYAISRETKLNQDQFLHAIDLVLSSTSFSFDGQFFQQVFGSPMGSPLSPILANIVMEDLETHCLEQLDFSVRFFLRYVDDILTIIPNDKIQYTLNIFNNYHPRLKFTYEIENDGSIPFLDTLIIRDNNRLVSNWYRKPTFSGRYVNFYSNHPLRYKLNTIIGLVDRAILLSDERFHESNIHFIKSILLNNCFPQRLINRHIDRRLKELNFRNENSLNTDSGKFNFDARRYIPLPFIKGLSENVRHVINKCGLDVLYKVPKQLSTIIKRGKDPLDVVKRTEVVYKINCNDCDVSYIGQTKRHLETRVKEHRNDLKKHEDNHSVVSKHRINFGHDFRWSSPEILHTEKLLKKRELAEMFFIKKHSNAINLKRDTDNLNPVYDKVIQIT